jgi:DHA2 family multidrug resistance protein
MNHFSGLIPGDAYRAAVTELSRMVQREALVLTYNDLLLLIGVLFVGGVMLMPLVRQPRSVLTADRH